MCVCVAAHAMLVADRAGTLGPVSLKSAYLKWEAYIRLLDGDTPLVITGAPVPAPPPWAGPGRAGPLDKDMHSGVAQAQACFGPGPARSRARSRARLITVALLHERSCCGECVCVGSRTAYTCLSQSIWDKQDSRPRLQAFVFPLSHPARELLCFSGWPAKCCSRLG